MAPKRCYSKEELLEEFDLSMQMQRKKQKSSRSVASHQLDEHFNDITASAEIDLQEEQDLLFSKAAGNKESTSKQDCQYSVHQEEEMFLSKTSLRAKLENIISKCGLKTLGKDVENCLLLALGEMLVRLIRNMIRMSKQRFDYEKKRHRILVTSDIHRYIMIMNQDQRKAQDEKPNKDISDGEIDKSAKGSAETKSNKKEKEAADLRLETVARANKAVRAFAGGDDFISKWKLRRKRQHEEVPVKGDQDQLNEKMNKGSKGTVQKFQGKGSENRVVSMKDVITTLEREPWMSKSIFLYQLYERSAVAATKDEEVKKTSS